MSLPRYPEYKGSGMPWVGTVPTHWVVQPLLSVAVERSEFNAGMRERNLLSLSYGRIIRKDIDSNDGLLPESFETYQIVRKGDIVLRLTDLQNDKRSLRSALVNEQGIITSAYLALRPTSVNPAYLAYLLRAYDLSKVFYSMGGGLRQSMKFADLRRMSIALPPLDEQTAITAFLDRETAKIDALIAEQEKLIALLAEKRQATISHAVTRGLNPDAPMKDSGVPWLGEVPAHWDMKRVKDCGCEIVDCKNRTPELHGNGDYFVVRTSCVKDGKFNPEPGYRTDEANFIEWTAKGKPRARDVLFTREAPTGEACLAPEGLDFCLGQRMMYIRPPEQVLLSEFLLYSIYGGLARERISEKSKGSTVGHLRIGEVGELPLLLPPLVEQHGLVEFVRDELAKIESLEVASGRAIALLKERRFALIAAAVTGQIDVRGAIPTCAEA